MDIEPKPSARPQHKNDTGIIKVDDWVVLEASDGKSVLGHVTGSKCFARLGKQKREISALRGACWGDLFSIGPGSSLELVCKNSPGQNSKIGPDAAVSPDNRNLQDTAGNQRLSERTIVRMKQKGVRGEDLVRAVVKNSSTFKGKTAYSQEKYLRRKREKFDLRVRALRPTAFTICDTYFYKAPHKIMNMRSDSLGLLLGYGGAFAHRHVLLYENCTGLVAGAVSERLDGHGRILNMFKGTTPRGVELIRILNLSENAKDSLVHVPFEILGALDEKEVHDDDPLRYVTREDMEDDLQVERLHVPSPKRAASIARRPNRGAVKEWIREGFDSLIVATRDDVVDTVDTLIQYLSPSGMFAVYCMHLQEAADLQYALQLSRLAIRVELTESMLVNHQMLEGRSHPEMTESATGGYIVSGVRIELPSGNDILAETELF